MGKSLQWFRGWLHPTCVFAASLLVGLAINVYWGRHHLTGDEGDYYALATRFAETWQYGSAGEQAYRAPLYPMVLGCVFRVFGDSLIAARIFNSLLAAGMCTGAGLMVARITRQAWPIYGAAILLMLNSYWWLHQVVLMQENLAALLLVSSVLCWPIFGSRDRATTKRIRKHGLWVVAGGCLFGLSLLAKPSLVPLFVTLPILSVAVSQHETRRTNVAFSIIYLASAAIILMPWTLRNYTVFGRIIPFSTGSGEVFLGSHSKETIANAPGSWLSTSLSNHQQKELEAVKPLPQRELRASELKWQAGWDSIRQSSHLQLAKHFTFKVLRLWSPSTYFESEQSGLPIKLALIAFNISVLILFAYSLFRPSSEEILLISIFISITITSLIFWGSIRFLYVAQPIVAGLAAQSIYRWYYRKAKTKPTEKKSINRRRQSTSESSEHLN